MGLEDINIYNGTYSTACSKEPEPLTLEKLRECIALIPKHPIETLANKHGFSIDAGDLAFLPLELKCHAELHHKNVCFSPVIDALYFTKADLFDFIKKFDDRLEPRGRGS